MINEKKNVLKEELNQNIFIFGPSLTNLDVGKRNIFPAPPPSVWTLSQHISPIALKKKNNS